MALGSHSLTPELINQFLEQLWVIACALKFNSLLYEVRFCVNYANKLSHCTNCTYFCEWWPTCDLYSYSTLLPLALLWNRRDLRPKLQCGANPSDIHWRGNTPSDILLTWWKDSICADVQFHTCLGVILTNEGAQCRTRVVKTRHVVWNMLIWPQRLSKPPNTFIIVVHVFFCPFVDCSPINELHSNTTSNWSAIIIWKNIHIKTSSLSTSFFIFHYVVTEDFIETVCRLCVKVQHYLHTNRDTTWAFIYCTRHVELPTWPACLWNCRRNTFTNNRKVHIVEYRYKH